MGRVWQRLGATVFFGVLVVGLLECKSNKQKPGDKCTHDNGFLCMDSNSAMICVQGTIEMMPCRGPKGCSTSGSGEPVCDDEIGKAGEACSMPPAGSINVACTADMKSELECMANKWTLVSGCKGPKGCKISNNNFSCDDDFAEVGDPCKTAANEANYSCTPDKKQEVVCKDNKFVSYRFCKGPHGCNVLNDKINCDDTFADEGDVCRHVDQGACTADAKSMLKCSPQFKWTKSKDCKKEGCKVDGNNLSCK
jgi:hypothetical protein